MRFGVCSLLLISGISRETTPETGRETGSETKRQAGKATEREREREKQTKKETDRHGHTQRAKRVRQGRDRYERPKKRGSRMRQKKHKKKAAGIECDDLIPADAQSSSLGPISVAWTSVMSASFTWTVMPSSACSDRCASSLATRRRPWGEMFSEFCAMHDGRSKRVGESFASQFPKLSVSVESPAYGGVWQRTKAENRIQRSACYLVRAEKDEKRQKAQTRAKDTTKKTNMKHRHKSPVRGKRQER